MGYIREPKVKPSERASSPEWEAKQATAKAKKKKTAPARAMKKTKRKGPRRGILVVDQMKKIVDQAEPGPRPSPIADLLSALMSPPPLEPRHARGTNEMLFGLGFLLLGALFMNRLGAPPLPTFPASEREPEFQDFLPDV